MKRIISSVLLVLLVAGAALAAGETEAEKDKAAIRKTIESAYIKGIHTDWDVELVMRKVT